MFIFYSSIPGDAIFLHSELRLECAGVWTPERTVWRRLAASDCVWMVPGTVDPLD